MSEPTDPPPPTPLEQDVIDAHGWSHYQTVVPGNGGHEGAWNAMANSLNAYMENPRAKTKREIPLSKDATVGADGSFLLKIADSDVKSYGPAFSDIISGNRFKQLFKAEYDALLPPPTEGP